jgi:hypothetical protein
MRDLPLLARLYRHQSGYTDLANKEEHHREVVEGQAVARDQQTNLLVAQPEPLQTQKITAKRIFSLSIQSSLLKHWCKCSKKICKYKVKKQIVSFL